MKCTECNEDIRCAVSIKTEEADRPIEISYQWWSCASCGAKYHATLEDSNVNMFDDRLRHEGYLIEESVWQKSLAWAKQCPQENNPDCKCIVHQEMPPSGFYGKAAWYTYD